LGSQYISGVQGNEGPNTQKKKEKKKQEIYCPEEHGSLLPIRERCYLELATHQLIHLKFKALNSLQMPTQSGDSLDRKPFDGLLVRGYQ
jgi:hypothetical protein